MRGRKYGQMKTYSKILKYKKETGEIQEVPQPKIVNQMKDEREELQIPDGTEFQEEFENQFEEEEAWVSESSDNEDQMGDTTEKQHGKPKNVEEKGDEKMEVFTGTKKNLKKGEVLDFDNNAYDMLHRLNTQWPSLSVDFVCRDSPIGQLAQFQTMNKYPYQAFTVQGSSNNSNNNSIYLTKWYKLHKTKYDDDPDVEGDHEDFQISNDDEAEVVVQEIQTTYNVNRLRTLLNSPIVAFWNDQAEIHIMDLTKNYEKLKNNIGTKKKENIGEENKIILKSSSEGFALAWNPYQMGNLITGNCLGHVQIFTNKNFTMWSKAAEYHYHHGSVEDLVFSPSEQFVFASCSSDGTLQLVDTRVGNMNKSQILVQAHNKDVNVCDWNRIASHLIVTGSDDCSVKVWDMRSLKKKNNKNTEQLLCFNWHSEPITSIKFQPNEESVVAVASEDNSISIWDMALENEQQNSEFPNELMFIHQGQDEIKQICYHPVYYEMLVSSASDGINILKPSFELPQQQFDCKQDLKKPPIHEEQLDKFLGR